MNKSKKDLGTLVSSPLAELKNIVSSSIKPEDLQIFHQYYDKLIELGYQHIVDNLRALEVGLRADFKTDAVYRLKQFALATLDDFPEELLVSAIELLAVKFLYKDKYISIYSGKQSSAFESLPLGYYGCVVTNDSDRSTILGTFYVISTDMQSAIDLVCNKVAIEDYS